MKKHEPHSITQRAVCPTNSKISEISKISTVPLINRNNTFSARQATRKKFTKTAPRFYKRKAENDEVAGDRIPGGKWVVQKKRKSGSVIKQQVGTRAGTRTGTGTNKINNTTVGNVLLPMSQSKRAMIGYRTRNTTQTRHTGHTGHTRHAGLARHANPKRATRDKLEVLEGATHWRS